MDQRTKAAVSVLAVVALLAAVALIVTSGDGDGDGGDGEALSSEGGCSSTSHVEDLSDAEDMEIDDERVPDTNLSSYEPTFSGARISCFDEEGQTSNEAAWTCEYPSQEVLGRDQISVDTNMMDAGSLHVAVEDAAGEIVFEETFQAPDRPGSSSVELPQDYPDDYEGQMPSGDTSEYPDPSEYAANYSEEYVYARTVDEENTPGEWTLRAETSDDYQGSYLAQAACSTQEPVGEGGSGDTVAVEDLDIQTPSAWPTVGFDDGRTSAFASSGGGTGGEIYRVEVDGDQYSGGPAVANGLIYVPVGSGFGSDAGGAVNAFDVNSGEKQWSFALNGSLASPLVAADGAVFAQTGDDGLYALNETGEQVWHSDGGGTSARLTVDDGSLYITFDGTLFAVDAANGELQWDKSLEGFGNNLRGHPVVQDGEIFVGANSDAGHLYAIDAATQTTEWVYDDEELNSAFSAATFAVADGAAFLADRSQIQAVDLETGEQAWSTKTTVDSQPLIAHGGLVLNQNGSSLEAFDQGSGELAWEATVYANPDEERYEASTREIVAAGDSLYVWATRGSVGSLLAFDVETGEVDWWKKNVLPPRDAISVDDVLFTIGQALELVALDGGHG